MPISKSNLKEGYRRKVLKALSRLDYSYKKVKNLPIATDELDEETLETWEGFTARFSRAVDLFLSKYLKACVLADDPGFQGSLRDFADYAEKLGLLDSADRWMELRRFRNLIAHEYEEEQLAQIFDEMRKVAPAVLAIKGKL